MENKTYINVDIANCKSKNEQVVIELIDELTSNFTEFYEDEVSFNNCMDYQNIISAIRKNDFDLAASYLNEGYAYFVEMWLDNASFATKGTSIILLDGEHYDSTEVVECLINDSGFSGSAHKKMIKKAWAAFFKDHQNYVRGTILENSKIKNNQ